MLTRRQATGRMMRRLYQREVLDKLDAPAEDDVPELGPEHLEEPLLEEGEVEAALEERLRESSTPVLQSRGKKHRWDKSVSTVWPLRCLDCGVVGRVKQGTAGTMQYSRTGTGEWVEKIPCAEEP